MSVSFVKMSLTVIPSDCDRYTAGFAGFFVFSDLRTKKLRFSATKHQQRQISDKKSSHHAHELMLQQAPPTLQRSGTEHHSGDTAPPVICYNRSLTWFV